MVTREARFVTIQFMLPVLFTVHTAPAAGAVRVMVGAGGGERTSNREPSEGPAAMTLEHTLLARTRKKVPQVPLVQVTPVMEAGSWEPLKLPALAATVPSVSTVDSVTVFERAAFVDFTRVSTTLQFAAGPVAVHEIGRIYCPSTHFVAFVGCDKRIAELIRTAVVGVPEGLGVGVRVPVPVEVGVEDTEPDGVEDIDSVVVAVAEPEDVEEEEPVEEGEGAGVPEGEGEGERVVVGVPVLVGLGVMEAEGEPELVVERLGLLVGEALLVSVPVGEAEGVGEGERVVVGVPEEVPEAVTVVELVPVVEGEEVSEPVGVPVGELVGVPVSVPVPVLLGVGLLESEPVGVTDGVEEREAVVLGVPEVE